MISVLRSVAAWLLLIGLLLPLPPIVAMLRLVVRDPERRAALVRACTEAAAAAYVRASPLYRLTITGREHLPEGRPWVLVANHESGIDAACLMCLRPHARVLAAPWLFRAPLIGYVMRACGHIPVRDREGQADPVARAIEALRRGENILVFPEGRYGQGAVERFRRGAFAAARESGAAVVPIRLQGSGAAWAPGSWIVHGRHSITLQIAPEIDPAVVRAAPVEVVAEQVRMHIEAMGRAS